MPALTVLNQPSIAFPTTPISAYMLNNITAVVSGSITLPSAVDIGTMPSVAIKSFPMSGLIIAGLPTVAVSSLPNITIGSMPAVTISGTVPVSISGATISASLSTTNVSSFITNTLLPVSGIVSLTGGGVAITNAAVPISGSITILNQMLTASGSFTQAGTGTQRVVNVVSTLISNDSSNPANVHIVDTVPVSVNDKSVRGWMAASKVNPTEGAIAAVNSRASQSWLSPLYVITASYSNSLPGSGITGDLVDITSGSDLQAYPKSVYFSAIVASGSAGTVEYTLEQNDGAGFWHTCSPTIISARSFLADGSYVGGVSPSLSSGKLTMPVNSSVLLQLSVIGTSVRAIGKWSAVAPLSSTTGARLDSRWILIY